MNTEVHLHLRGLLLYAEWGNSCRRKNNKLGNIIWGHSKVVRIFFFSPLVIWGYDRKLVKLKRAYFNGNRCVNLSSYFLPIKIQYINQRCYHRRDSPIFLDRILHCWATREAHSYWHSYGSKISVSHYQRLEMPIYSRYRKYIILLNSINSYNLIQAKS